MSATGTLWDVDEVASVTDGDTLRIYRSQVIRLGDDWFRIHDTDEQGNRRSVPIRLVWVDTPERGDHPGWEQAKTDLIRWVDGAGLPRPRVTGSLRVVCYESAGWDRTLGDLIDADGNSASRWLMTERGWAPYIGRTGS